MTAAPALGLPPAGVRNGQTVFAESAQQGTTVHVNPACQHATPHTFLVKRRCTAIQATVWLRPWWCPYCTREQR